MASHRAKGAIDMASYRAKGAIDMASCRAGRTVGPCQKAQRPGRGRLEPAARRICLRQTARLMAPMTRPPHRL